LQPATCTKCGKEAGFTRRLFEIKGVPKRKQNDDTIQGLIRNSFIRQYSIEFVFLKTHGASLFVDSAICPGCGSTAVNYDIELSDDFLASAAKLAGQDPAEFKRGFEAFCEKLKKS